MSFKKPFLSTAAALVVSLSAVTTQAAVSPISIEVGNASFEGPTFLPDSGGTPDSWLGIFPQAGVFRPVTHPSLLYPEQDGDQLAYLLGSEVSALFQDTVAIEHGTYTFTAAVAGEPGKTPDAGSLRLAIEAVDNPGVGEVKHLVAFTDIAASSLSSTNLNDFSVTLDSTVAFNHLGQTLRLVIVHHDTHTSELTTYNVDNVRLDFVAVPEPATLSLLGVFSPLLLRRRRRR